MVWYMYLLQSHCSSDNLLWEGHGNFLCLGMNLFVFVSPKPLGLEMAAQEIAMNAKRD